MKTVHYLFGLLLLAGCGGDEARPPTRHDYPALDESPPPPPPPLDVSAPSEQPSARPSEPPAEVTGDGWVQRQEQKAELVKRLREYSAKAAPDDPFALTEEQIKAISKHDNPVLY
jgi:hypothetical protein